MAPLDFFTVLALVSGLLLSPAGAQSPANMVPPDQAPKPATPALPMVQGGAWRYVSVLAQYQPYADQSVGSWPEANATVQGIGGWRAYAREMQGPAAVPPASGARP
jgi:hypothetical protein